MTEVSHSTEEVVAGLRPLLGGPDDEPLREYLRDLHAADVADCLEQVEPEERSRILFLLPPRTAAETVVLLDDPVRSDVLEGMTERQVTNVLMELPSDDVVDLLDELDEDVADKVFEDLPPKQQAILEPLREYDESSAGGIMRTELVSVPEGATAADAIEEIRRLTPDETRDVFEIYCVDSDGRLQGVVPSLRLLTAKPSAPVSRLMRADPLTVNVKDDQEVVKNQFEKYDVAVLPVVDDEGRLLGVITHDDVLEVAEEEAEEDILLMAGTDPDEFATSSIFNAATVRARWLLPCLAGTFVAAMIIFFLKPQLGPLAIVVIPFIMPIAAMGGNAGVQTSTVIVRSLATGDVLGSRLRTAFARESRIALLVGAGAGLFAAVGAGLVLRLDLMEHGEVILPVLEVALAVGLSMALAILVSTTLGMVLPFLFRQIGIDPAIATGPLITTCNDAVSTAIYLLISIQLLPRDLP